MRGDKAKGEGVDYTVWEWRSPENVPGQTSADIKPQRIRDDSHARDQDDTE